MVRNGYVLCCVLGFLMLATPWESTASAEEVANTTGESQAPDRWGPLALLEGTWTGAIQGALGTGTGVRRYEFLMDGQFLMSRHNSVRLPQEKSPEGDQHEEIGVFSYDSERDLLVLREFMGEGVVIRSVCTVEEMTVECASEAVESGPGIRARLTIRIQDRYRFTERYEIAWHNQEKLQPYFNNQWTRVPDSVDQAANRMLQLADVGSGRLTVDH